MLPPVTVLATSVGNDGFASVRPALKDNGEREIRLIGVDANPAAVGLFLADVGAVAAPRRDSDTLLDQLVELCRQHRVDVLLPLSTEDQEFYATHAERFTAMGVRVAVSPLAGLRCANDKLALLRVCEPAGVPCPRFCAVTSVEELAGVAADLGYPDRPVVLKLNRGTGAQGVKIIDPALIPLARLFDRDNLRVGYDDVRQGLLGADPFPPMHLAEYLPGREFSVDVLCRDGETISAVVRDRLATLYGLATHAIVVDDPVAEKAARRVVDLLGLSYVVNVQFRCDEQGTPRLMEVNPRIPGTIGLSVAAGVNMPYLAVKLALGEAVAPPPPVLGTEFIRYWNAVIRGPESA